MATYGAVESGGYTSKNQSTWGWALGINLQLYRDDSDNVWANVRVGDQVTNCFLQDATRTAYFAIRNSSGTTLVTDTISWSGTNITNYNGTSSNYPLTNKTYNLGQLTAGATIRLTRDNSNSEGAIGNVSGSTNVDGWTGTASVFTVSVPAKVVSGTPTITASPSSAVYGSTVTLTLNKGTTASGYSESFYGFRCDDCTDETTVTSAGKTKQVFFKGSASSPKTLTVTPSSCITHYGTSPSTYYGYVSLGSKGTKALGYAYYSCAALYGSSGVHASNWVVCAVPVYKPNVYVYNSSGAPKRAEHIYVYNSSGVPKEASDLYVYNSSGVPKSAFALWTS